MGLITETNSQYYNGEQIFFVTALTSSVTCTLDTQLYDSGSTTPGSIANYNVYVSTSGNIAPNDFALYTGTATVENNIVTFNPPIPGPTGGATKVAIKLELIAEAKWNNYGGYEYISLKDVIDNFMIAYVGEDKLIPRVKRTDVLFHAKRGLQEFSYDTLKSINSIEITLANSLSYPIPQDYVNYVEFSWVDALGVKHIIYPTTLTSNPTQLPLQDANGMPIQDEYGENTEAAQAKIDERWKKANDRLITGEFDSDYYMGVYDWYWWKMAYGQRYGLEPETSQKNGWFTINEREGRISFSSDLANQLIIMQYISDGLAYDLDMKIPKMAEQAIYMHIVHGIVSTRANMPEYVVRRYKKERSAALRNAKIRLSDIKLGAFTQVMRGKSKWLKN